ncbi:hypothetical protein LOTGIDRAFT_168744 [Lottia gigantea]|uniref:Uncharacterized protein n=1 Tax=Lottia gigantea TaxID=225164 RepID=V3ZJ58_LOTGI|nr:hypothetical protein LOTGIDRAFT_168744 [Lottia gigantea]ESO84302.1 hypothetical protein LOTGIDRAFT_168744 [Lottia gigantea]
MASNEMEPFADLKLNSTSPGLLGSSNLEELYWIIPVVIAAIIFMFMAAYGLFNCIVNIGDSCMPKCYAACGCCRPSRDQDHEERIRLLDYSRPMYESSTNEDTSVQML